MIQKKNIIILVSVSVLIGVLLIIFVVVVLTVGKSKKASSLQQTPSGKREKEAFYYNRGREYQFASEMDAQNICHSLGCTLATIEHVEVHDNKWFTLSKKAYDMGAQWCGYGWIKGGTKIYPMEEYAEKCEGIRGLVKGNPRYAGAICYGYKPDRRDDVAEFR
jgi:hypothetical protein